MQFLSLLSLTDYIVMSMQLIHDYLVCQNLGNLQILYCMLLEFYPKVHQSFPQLVRNESIKCLNICTMFSDMLAVWQHVYAILYLYIMCSTAYYVE